MLMTEAQGFLARLQSVLKFAVLDFHTHRAIVAAGSQCIERTQDVTLADPPAQRDYMWVLKKQEGIGD